MALLVVLLLIVSTTSFHASSASEPWLDPRLPRDLLPMRYDLFMQLHVNDKKYAGKVSIEMLVLKKTRFIIVHAGPMTISNTTVFVNETSVQLRNVFAHKRNWYWVVQTVEPMELFTMVKLDLEFNGDIGPLGGGIYHRSFADKKAGRYSPMVLTEFKPDYARMVFPNFDEPFFKSQFTITLRHWANYTAVSNMPVQIITDIGRDWRDSKFEVTPPISSFAVGFVISDHVYRNSTLPDGKLHRVWVRSERADQVDYALKVTRIVYGFLNREIGNISSLPKIDHIGVPFTNNRGGDAQWGLFNHDEGRLTYNATLFGDKFRQTTLTIIATALARNYFGLLVTCLHWNHVWLDSGLARLYGLKAAAAVEPLLFEEQQLKERCLHDDATNNSRPLVIPRSNTTEEPDVDHHIIFSKGSAVLKMMENFLGANTFNRGIRRYIDEFEQSTVHTREFFGVIQMFAPESTNIADIMKTWVHSMGYPLITIRRLPNNRISSKQKRFLMDPLADPNYPPSTHGYKWYVPLNYRTKGGSTGRVWMNKTDAVFNNLLNASDNWILFNYDQSGYYRVNYDSSLWNKIIKQLKNDHTVFTDLERSQLLSDALNIAAAEQLEFDVALNLTMYASNERSLSSWTHIYDALGNINQMLFNTSDFRSHQRYLLNLTTNVMNELKVVDEGTIEQKLLREKIMSLACSAGHRGCIENTTQLFKAWIQNKLNVIPMNIRRIVYCHGIANSGNESEWNTTFSRFVVKKDLTTERESLMLGLACTKNLTLIHRYIEACISNDTTRKLWCYDVDKAVRKFSENPEASAYIWEWVKVNRAQIDYKLYSSASARLAYDATYNFNTEAQLQEVRQFFAGLKSDQHVEESKRLTMERISSNIHWMKTKYLNVSRWLQQNFPI